MDLFFEPSRGKEFTIEIGYFDTVLEIKEKIQKYQGIPVSKQTLIFKEKVLDDELNVHYSDILDRSILQLIIAPETGTETEKQQIISVEEVEEVEQESSSNSKKIQLKLKLKTVQSKCSIPIEVGGHDNIRSLKEKVQEVRGFPINRVVIRANGIELHEDMTIHDSGLTDHSELQVTVKSFTLPGNAKGAKKLKIIALTEDGTRRIPFEVNPMDKLVELRKELNRLNLELQLNLPENDEFHFFHKGRMMSDDRSFEMHCVRSGYIISILRDKVNIAPETETEMEKQQIINTEEVEEESPSNSKKIQLKLRLKTVQSKLTIKIDEADGNHTIRSLKEKVQEERGFPINRLVIRANGIELHDDQTIHDSGLTDHSELQVTVRSFKVSGNATGKQKLKIIALAEDGTRRIPFEVNPMDKLAELRKELKRLNQELQLNLPENDAFYFSREGIVMSDDRSFRMYCVHSGDIIEIKRGRVIRKY